jgi:hypothetical protein
MLKLAKEAANNALARLDKIAATIQANYETWGMPFETAKAIVNDIDKVADEIEVNSFGKESFQRRQAEVIQDARMQCLRERAHLLHYVLCRFLHAHQLRARFLVGSVPRHRRELQRQPSQPLG